MERSHQNSWKLQMAQSPKCGRWLVISSHLESETETETMESETASK